SAAAGYGQIKSRETSVNTFAISGCAFIFLPGIIYMKVPGNSLELPNQLSLFVVSPPRGG
ncbi:MAG: hypothetical protein D3910_08670, partial [Candidatus Electrothrix sp. ATG2]|nr:hypothetical protein [Candidatus Electrothrix sp. ATG2]